MGLPLPKAKEKARKKIEKERSLTVQERKKRGRPKCTSCLIAIHVVCLSAQPQSIFNTVEKKKRGGGTIVYVRLRTRTCRCAAVSHVYTLPGEKRAGSPETSEAMMLPPVAQNGCCAKMWLASVGTEQVIAPPSSSTIPGIIVWCT